MISSTNTFMSIDIPMLDNEYIYIKLILAWHKYTVLEPSLKTELHVVAKKKKKLIRLCGCLHVYINSVD